MLVCKKRKETNKKSQYKPTGRLTKKPVRLNGLLLLHFMEVSQLLAFYVLLRKKNICFGDNALSDKMQLSGIIWY